MNGPADVEVGQAREVERLGDDALSAKSGVAVNRHAQDARPERVGVAEGDLEAAREAERDGRDGLEVGRVGEEVDRERVGRARGRVGRRREEVRQDVVGELRGREGRRERGKAAHLADQDAHVEVEELRQEVEPAAVRHAEHDVLDALLLGLVEQRRTDDHHGLSALEAVPLDIWEALGEEVVEPLGLGQELPVGELFIGIERLGVRLLEHRLEKAALVLAREVHELRARRRRRGCERLREVEEGERETRGDRE